MQRLQGGLWRRIGSPSLGAELQHKSVQEIDGFPLNVEPIGCDPEERVTRPTDADEVVVADIAGDPTAGLLGREEDLAPVLGKLPDQDLSAGRRLDAAQLPHPNLFADADQEVVTR